MTIPKGTTTCINPPDRFPKKWTDDPLSNYDFKFLLYEKLMKQAAADITGPLQVRPMVYTLYIGINLTIIMKQYGDRQTDTNI